MHLFRNPKFVYSIALLLVALASLLGFSFNKNTVSTLAGTHLVTKVIDGDTIQLETGETVRFIGIDTPETVKPNTKVECFGKEASNKTKELLEGSYVRLEKDVSETDKYGRLLKYVYLNEIFVNDYLVLNGYAYAKSYPPDIKYQDQFFSSEKQARQQNKGLWEVCENN